VRRVGESERWVRRGAWKGWSCDQFLGQDIHGSTLGIIGMGRIGQAVARRAMAHLAADNLIAALGYGPHAGSPPNTVNPQVRRFAALRISMESALARHCACTFPMPRCPHPIRSNSRWP